ncbi:MAG: hypothetical protein EU533_02200 [Promethearchaeota archaeon]|nr:MAG: hypothetical protein EU533_02200 [Candidatus Lokiarchaeota archaeon]
MSEIKRKIKILFIISIFSLFSFISVPKRIVAEEWNYEGIDTEKIPEFSVYPSECYSWIYLEGSYFYGHFMMIKITKANYSDTYSHFSLLNFPMGSNGTCIWAEQWLGDVSTGETELLYENIQLVYWNKSVGYRAANTILIPLEENGIISEETFVNATENWQVSFFSTFNANFEYFNANVDSLSCKYWNETHNKAYFLANYTDDGVLKDLESHTFFGMPNITLLSKPPQKPPDFDIKTESGDLVFESKNVILNLTIFNADNNNDGIVDDEYLYRMFVDNQWTDWVSPTEKINWTLNGNETANHTIIIEVKNMYGITQEELTITYISNLPGLFTLTSTADDPDPDGAFDLAWTTSSLADNYSIYSYNAPITNSNINDATLLGSGYTELQYSISGLTNGTYYYTILSLNEYGQEISNCISIVVEIPPTNGGQAKIPFGNSFFIFFLVGIIIVFLRKPKYKIK